jgi:hypothetical protein
MPTLESARNKSRFLEEADRIFSGTREVAKGYGAREEVEGRENELPKIRSLKLMRTKGEIQAWGEVRVLTPSELESGNEDGIYGLSVLTKAMSEPVLLACVRDGWRVVNRKKLGQLSHGALPFTEEAGWDPVEDKDALAYIREVLDTVFAPNSRAAGI